MKLSLSTAVFLALLSLLAGLAWGLRWAGQERSLGKPAPLQIPAVPGTDPQPVASPRAACREAGVEVPAPKPAGAPPAIEAGPQDLLPEALALVRLYVLDDLDNELNAQRLAQLSPSLRRELARAVLEFAESPEIRDDPDGTGRWERAMQLALRLGGREVEARISDLAGQALVDQAAKDKLWSLFAIETHCPGRIDLDTCPVVDIAVRAWLWSDDPVIRQLADGIILHDDSGRYLDRLREAAANPIYYPYQRDLFRARLDALERRSGEQKPPEEE